MYTEDDLRGFKFAGLDKNGEEMYVRGKSKIVRRSDLDDTSFYFGRGACYQIFPDVDNPDSWGYGCFVGYLDVAIEQCEKYLGVATKKTERDKEE